MPFVTKPVSILSFLVLLSSVTFTFATILPPYVHNPFAVQPYSYGFTSGRFLARAISEDPFINGQTLGQYHTPSGVSIANLYSAGGQASDRDYVYLTGEGSYELFLQWDRAPMGSNALYYAPGGENQPLVIKEAIESDDALIKGLYTGGNSPLTHIVEGFTFTGTF